MDSKTIVFDEWETILKQTVAPELQRGYREAIVKFRYWLKQTGKTPDVETFKTHLEWKKSYLSPERYEIRREALRWYYKNGLRWLIEAESAAKHGLTAVDDIKKENSERETTTQPVYDPQPESVKERQLVSEYRTYLMSDVPTAGARDLGKEPWEKELVKRIREKHLAWKSEKTYRGWCRRFMASCGGKQPEVLDHEDVRRWLSDLAVKGRVSVATQSQALNAVVFLFREVFQRDPGDFSDFIRARRGRKVPTVLTQSECKRLFEAMSGTSRLMAELM